MSAKTTIATGEHALPERRPPGHPARAVAIGKRSAERWPEDPWRKSSEDVQRRRLGLMRESKEQDRRAPPPSASPHMWRRRRPPADALTDLPAAYACVAREEPCGVDRHVHSWGGDGKRGATPRADTHDVAPTDSKSRANSGINRTGISRPASACCHFRLHGFRRRPYPGMAMPRLACGGCDFAARSVRRAWAGFTTVHHI